MQVERGTPDREQEAAFNNRDVKRLVELLAGHDFAPGLLVIARKAVISPRPSSRAALRAELGVADTHPLVDAAVAIDEAGTMIGRVTDGAVLTRRFAAAFERLVWAMCLSRRPNSTDREAHVVVSANKHIGSSRTGRLDVLVTDDPFEAYECKFGGGIEQDDIDDLGAVWVTARGEGIDPRPCVATWGSFAQLDLRIKHQGIVLDEVLYYADEEQLLLGVIRKRPPSARLR